VGAQTTEGGLTVSEERSTSNNSVVVLVCVIALALLLCCALSAGGLAIMYIRGDAEVASVSESGPAPLPPASGGTIAEPTPELDATTSLTTTVGLSAEEAAPEVGLPPQPQVRHPTWYAETGRTVDNQAKTVTWTIDIIEGTILIVGGYEVNGQSGGVYKAWAGAQSVQVTVTDGFALLIQDAWAEEEFCFRIGEAEKYGWAHSVVEPLAGWNCQ